jgi:hypothetical protein
MFQLNELEKAEVVANCDHLANLKFTKVLPFAFTEHGALMAASVLNTPEAVKVSLYVVRTFVQLRELLFTHRDLAAKLEALEERTEALAYQHDSFSRNTRVQLKQVFDALKELMHTHESSSRPIGFITDKGKSKNSSE